MAAMTTTHAVPLAAAALALLAGCGSDPAADRAKQRERFEDAAVKFAQCMREHGVDVPDPSGGRLTLRAGPGADGANANPKKVDEAQQACRPILAKAGGPPELSDERREELQRQALAFARCMRRQGIDMPDPEFGPGGAMRQRVGGPGRRADPGDTRFRDAEKKCRQFRPKPPGGPGEAP